MGRGPAGAEGGGRARARGGRRGGQGRPSAGAGGRGGVAGSRGGAPSPYRGAGGRRGAAGGSGGGGGDFDPLAPDDGPQLDPEMAELFRKHQDSEFLNSPVVQGEVDALMASFQELTALYPKFGNFDTEGKAIFLEQFEGLCEKMEVFQLRLQLSEDPLAASMKERLDEQLAEVNLTPQSMIQSLRRSTQAMQGVVEEERRTGVAGGGAAPDSPFGSRIASILPALMADPEVAPMLGDPEFLKLMQEMMQGDPRQQQDAAQRDPRVQKLAGKIFELMNELDAEQP